MDGAFEIKLTDAAARRIKSLLQKGDASHLRLGVKGGGCAGYSYTFELTSAINRGEDFEIAPNGDHFGANVVVDKTSAALLSGSTLDFGESLLESGFRVINPAADSSCGCGVSFALKD